MELVTHYIDFSMWLGRIICITDPGEAAARDHRMKAELERTGGTPVPTDKAALGPRIWCERAAHAGELSVQGFVEANGKRDRLDEAVGRGWLVIGLDRAPQDALTPEQMVTLRGLEGRTVKIGSPGTDCDAEDVEGTYAKWLSEINAIYVVIRPDFYAAATDNSPQELRRQLGDILSRLHLTDQASATAQRIQGAVA